MQFTYPRASIKDVQATGEAFSPQREHPALQNRKFLNIFHFLGSFLPSTDLIDSGSNSDLEHWY
jgi:hypothetical protein